MSALWTTDAMVKAMNARAVGNMPDGITGISIDTRSLLSGEAYFAIAGDIHDGHKFLANAHKAGAGLSVVSEDWLGDLEGNTGALLVVRDVLAALEDLGRAARTRTDAKIIAVTGSVGKTSTKEALRTALEPSGEVHAAVASFNNHWGVPLTLARMPQSTQFGVIEIGMNHPGEISPLVKMARPHVAIINNVAAVHLGAFSTVDEIAHAKAEIFDGLRDGGVAVLNADDERFELLKSLAKAKSVSRIVSFGEAEGADIKLKQLVPHLNCSCLTVSVLGDEMVVKVGAPGRHIAQNVLAVLAAVKLTGADLALAGIAMGDMQPVKGRGQQHLVGEGDSRFLVIDESYNANPASMKAALSLLAAAEPRGRGRRIAVLGDMLELGTHSAAMHADLAEPIIAASTDHLFLMGPEMCALKDALDGKLTVSHASDIDTLVERVVSELAAGDVVMVKASNSMNFSRLIDALVAD